MRALPARWIVVLLGMSLAAGCGGGAAGQAGADAGAFDADLGWPTVDPSPDAAVHGGPTFGDAGAQADGPAAPACTGKAGVTGHRTFSRSRPRSASRRGRSR